MVELVGVGNGKWAYIFWSNKHIYVSFLLLRKVVG